MTEFEILQIQAMYVDTLNANFMNYISILSGYLIASYFLGSKLKLTQFVILTVGYIYIMVTNTFAVLTQYNLIFEAEFALQKMDRTWQSQYLLSNADNGLTLKYLAVIAQILVTIGSVYFSLKCRGRDEKQA